MKKIIVLVVVTTMLIVSNIALANTNIVNVNINNEPPLEQSGKTGYVGWEQGSNGTIEAMGTGIAPANVINPSQGRMLARRAAIVDAYRNLAELTQGVRVDSETTVQNLAVTNDVVKTQISALIQGARIIREIPGNDGTYAVVMSMNMYGSGSLAQVVFDTIKPDKIESFPAPSSNYVPDTAGISVGEYTGVVIVAQNMGLQSTFSPRVYDENGNIVYGNKYIDPDFAIKYGMVDYSKLDAAMAGNSRAGTKPLIVNALRVVDHNCNVVISNDDAQKILAAHAKGNFLARCAVVFSR